MGNDVDFKLVAGNGCAPDNFRCNSPGLQLVYVSLTLMAIGILWMWRLIQIRV